MFLWSVQLHVPNKTKRKEFQKKFGTPNSTQQLAYDTVNLPDTSLPSFRVYLMDNLSTLFLMGSIASQNCRDDLLKNEGEGDKPRLSNITVCIVDYFQV